MNPSLSLSKVLNASFTTDTRLATRPKSSIDDTNSCSRITWPANSDTSLPQSISCFSGGHIPPFAAVLTKVLISLSLDWKPRLCMVWSMSSTETRPLRLRSSIANAMRSSDVTIGSKQCVRMKLITRVSYLLLSIRKERLVHACVVAPERTKSSNIQINELL